MRIDKFCEYIEEIGIIDLDSIGDFLETFTYYSDSSKYNIHDDRESKDCLVISLYRYLKENCFKDTHSLNTLCNRILEKYTKSLCIKKISLITSLGNILNGKLKEIKIKTYFELLLGISKLENKAENIILNFEKEKEVQKHKNRFNTESQLTSKQLKELDELSQCSFNPIINKQLKQNNNKDENPSRFNRLYNESFRQMERRQDMAINNLRKESMSCTFSPKNLKRSKSMKCINNSCLELNSGRFNDTFGKNLSYFHNKKQNKILDLILENQKKFDKIYSFKPKLKSYDTMDKLSAKLGLDNRPRYIKLFEDSKIKDIKLQDRIVKIYSEFENEKFCNKNKRSKSLSCSNLNLNLSLDIINKSSYFEKLYLDARINNEKKIDLIKNYYKEFSYYPKINSNIKVKSSFDQRNITNDCPKKTKEKTEKNLMKNYQNKTKILTKDEIEDNNIKVVERLYQKEMTKLREKSNEKKNELDLLKQLKKEHKIKFKKVDITIGNEAAPEERKEKKYIEENIVMDDVNTNTNTCIKQNEYNLDSIKNYTDLQTVSNNKILHPIFPSQSSVCNEEIKTEHYRSKALELLLKGRDNKKVIFEK